MSISAGVGLSKNKDPHQAGYEAARVAVQKSGQAKPDFVIAFASTSSS